MFRIEGDEVSCWNCDHRCCENHSIECRAVKYLGDVWDVCCNNCPVKPKKKESEVEDWKVGDRIIYTSNNTEYEILGEHQGMFWIKRVKDDSRMLTLYPTSYRYYRKVEPTFEVGKKYKVGPNSYTVHTVHAVRGSEVLMTFMSVSGNWCATMRNQGERKHFTEVDD
jgi:hypothetical protein